MMTKTPTLDRIVDAAYDRWNAKPVGERWSKKQFRSNLIGLECLFVPMSQFVAQVQNGGFMQWMDNGYAELDISQVNTLLGMLHTPTAQTVLGMLSQFVHIARQYAGGIEPSNDMSEDEYEEMMNALGAMDSPFYDLDDQLLDEVEAFVVSLHADTLAA